MRALVARLFSSIFHKAPCANCSAYVDKIAELLLQLEGVRSTRKTPVSLSMPVADDDHEKPEFPVEPKEAREYVSRMLDNARLLNVRKPEPDSVLPGYENPEDRDRRFGAVTVLPLPTKTYEPV